MEPDKISNQISLEIKLQKCTLDNLPNENFVKLTYTVPRIIEWNSSVVIKGAEMILHESSSGYFS